MVERDVLLTRLLIREDCVAMTEGAAGAVLAGESYRRALEEQRSERERFGERNRAWFWALNGASSVMASIAPSETAASTSSAEPTRTSRRAPSRGFPSGRARCGP